ncbi:transcriptional regulatory protein DEP1 [Apiospora arundinis]
MQNLNRFRNKYVLLALAPTLLVALLLQVPIYYPDSNGYPQLVIGHSCDANQTNAVYQAHYDAEEMAYVALGGHDGDDGRNITINWDSTAAIDYFGSPSENFAYSEHILRTLALASGVDTGWRNGGDDLANRAILVACNDPMDRCKSVSTAYTYNGLDQDAPPDQLLPRLLPATVALHQLLHINSSWPANVCAGGCKDTLQELDRGREMVWTYRAGLAKLLARRNVMAASQTVDNYVYYVMSRWIEVKNANEYPPYPVAWNPDQSRRWNEDREASEPGTPLPVTAALDIEDSDVA